MSVSVQSLPSPLPLMHMPAQGTEKPVRGEMPDGTTLEKVLAVISAINLTLTTASGVMLIRLNNSVAQLQKLTEEKQKLMFTQAFVITLLGAAAGAATFTGGLGYAIAPQLQQLSNKITPTVVESTAKAAATVLEHGSKGYSTLSDGHQAGVDADRNRVQSLVQQAAQEANNHLERQRDGLITAANAILNAKSRANGG